jgi:uncharacterized protein YjbI with pentapeptide repeats
MASVRVEIRSRWTDEVLFAAEVPEGLERGLHMRVALEQATAARANLRGANLRGADLSGATLRDANLSGANLSDATLRGANLRGENLSDANLSDANLSDANLSDATLRGATLRGANLSDANLRGANLSDANLRGADLSGATLRGANLRGANLSGADLSGATLRGANLSDANLSDANLSDATGADYAIAQTRILPDGDLIGWKKCSNGVLVKLRIPADAKRSSAFGRKCRAEFVDVLEVIGAEFGVTSNHGPRTEYRVGQRVTPDKWDDNWQDECSHGLHFFITRLEAENY